MRRSFVVGVDEAGRGPLAGPLAVCSLVIKKPLPRSLLLKIKGRDSKKLSENKREEIFRSLKDLQKAGTLDFKVSFVSNKVIDRKGLSFAIARAISNSLEALSLSSDAEIFLDGGLRAPQSFKNQKTVIRGDESIPVIGLASVAAKVLRDRKMKSYCRKFPRYGFSIHKGYGTAGHREALGAFGLCLIHRTSFLKNFPNLKKELVLSDK